MASASPDGPAPEASATLAAAAFMDDPFYRWFLPRASAREPALRALMRRAFAGCHVSVVSADGVVPDALIAIHDPDLPASGGPRHGRLRLASLLLRPLRTLRAARFLLALRRHHPAEPHVRLEILAVAAHARGRGLARELMDGVIARADARAMAVHLETTNPDNLAFYRRFGFVEVGQVHVMRDGPRAWIMRRPPTA